EFQNRSAPLSIQLSSARQISTRRFFVKKTVNGYDVESFYSICLRLARKSDWRSLGAPAPQGCRHFIWLTVFNFNLRSSFIYAQRHFHQQRRAAFDVHVVERLRHCIVLIQGPRAVLPGLFLGFGVGLARAADQLEALEIAPPLLLPLLYHFRVEF